MLRARCPRRALTHRRSAQTGSGGAHRYEGRGYASGRGALPPGRRQSAGKPLPPLDVESAGPERDLYSPRDAPQHQQHSYVVLAPANEGSNQQQHQHQQPVVFPASPALAAPWAQHHGPPMNGHAPQWAEQGQDPATPSSVVRDLREAPRHRLNALHQGYAVGALNDAAEGALPARMRSWDVWRPEVDASAAPRTTPASVVPPRGPDARKAHTPPPKGMSPAAPGRGPRSGRRGVGPRATHLTDVSALSGYSGDHGSHQSFLSPQELTAAWADLADGGGDPHAWPTPSPFGRERERPPPSPKRSPSPRRKASGFRVSPHAPTTAPPLRGSPRVPRAPGRGGQSPRGRRGGALVLGGDFAPSPRGKRTVRANRPPASGHSFETDAGAEWVSLTGGEATPPAPTSAPGPAPHPPHAPPAHDAGQWRGGGPAPRVRRRMGGIALPPGGSWPGVAPGRGSAARRIIPVEAPRAVQPQEEAARPQLEDIWQEEAVESDSDEAAGAAVTLQRTFRGHQGRREAERRRSVRDSDQSQSQVPGTGSSGRASAGQEGEFDGGWRVAQQDAVVPSQTASESSEEGEVATAPAHSHTSKPVAPAIQAASVAPSQASPAASEATAPAHSHTSEPVAPATQAASVAPGPMVVPDVSERGELGSDAATPPAAEKEGISRPEDGAKGAGLTEDASSDEDEPPGPAVEVVVGGSPASPRNGGVEPVVAPEAFAEDESERTDSLERVEKYIQERNGMPRGLSGSLSVISESEAESRLDRSSDAETHNARSRMRPSQVLEEEDEDEEEDGHGSTASSHETRRLRLRQRQAVIWAAIQIQRMVRRVQAKQSTKQVAKQLWRPRKNRAVSARTPVPPMPASAAALTSLPASPPDWAPLLVQHLDGRGKRHAAGRRYAPGQPATQGPGGRTQRQGRAEWRRDCGRGRGRGDLPPGARPARLACRSGRGWEAGHAQGVLALRARGAGAQVRVHPLPGGGWVRHLHHQPVGREQLAAAWGGRGRRRAAPRHKPAAAPRRGRRPPAPQQARAQQQQGQVGPPPPPPPERQDEQSWGGRRGGGCR